MELEGIFEMTERETKEIHHALYYARFLAHGTLGHNQLLLIARLATRMGFRLEGNTLRLPDNVIITRNGKTFQ